MTPKEKAIKLLDTFTQTNGNSFFAKVCAFIVVDEILKYQPYDIYTIEQCDNVHKYWQEVKSEIENF